MYAIRSYYALVDAAEKRLLAPREFLGIARIVLNLVFPHRLRKRFEIVVDELQDVADRLPLGRVVIIDEDGLAAFGQFLQHVIDDLVLLFLRHFVQQEEAANESYNFV